MALSNLFAEAIRQGASNPTEVIRDLSALLGVLSVEKQTTLLGDIRSELASDTTALGIVDNIEAESKKTNLPFGPVLLDTPGYIQRLTILVEVGGFKNYPNGIKTFVEDSFGKDKNSLIMLFTAAEAVDATLSIFSKQSTWRKEVIPCLLQQTLSDSSLLLELTSAASGTNNLPSDWGKVELWVEVHLKRTQFKLPGVSSATDKGFFTSLRSNYQPAATHPLTLRILKKPTLFSKEKDAAGVEVSADEVRLKFSEWLVDNIFDGSGVHQNLPLEYAFAAGAFVLEMARGNGVVVHSNGEVAPSENPWANLSSRVLERIVLNSESTSNIPSAWQEQQPLIKRIISACPEWQIPEVLSNLRSRATQRLTSNLDEVVQTFSAKTVDLTDTQFLPKLEKFAVVALPDLRPSILIPDSIFISNGDSEKSEEEKSKIVLDNLQRAGGGWNEYIKNLRDQRKADDDIVSFSNSTEEIVKATAIVRQGFETTVISPFVESSLIEQRIEKKERVTNLALGSYLDRCIANLSLDKLESDVSQTWQPFENQSAWKTWINQSSSASNDALLQVWAGLEAWDGLRGRFLELEERDRPASDRLYNQARVWLAADPATTNVDEWRPQLAAIAHLGIPVGDPLFKALTERLEAVIIGRGIAGQPREALLIAARFELGITAIAANTQPASAFSTYLGDIKNQKEELLQCIKVALKSTNAWEIRAGFNMLILLSRLAESTGDLYFKAILYNALQEPLAQSLIATAISKFLEDTGTFGLSGLPLALAAFDLTRSARESAQAITLANQTSSPWVGQLSTTTTSLTDELAKRLNLRGRSALKSFVSEGGLAAKNLVLALFQIKLDELQLNQQLTVKPLRTSDSAYVQLENLKRTVRSLFCGEQLLLNDAWEVDTDDQIVPWWQAQYWFNKLTQDQNTPIIPEDPISPFPSSLGSTLDEEKLPNDIQNALGLTDTNDAIVRVQQWEGKDGEERQGVRWLLLAQKGEQEYVRILKKSEDGDSISVYQIVTPFCLFNWSAAYKSNAEISLLSQAAVLEAAVPVISEPSLDIDGFHEREFPGLSWKAGKEDLEKAVKALEEAEGAYKIILDKQDSGDATAQIITLLQQPLRLNTADYKEQILSAIADVRQAEAELEASEQELIASNFEVFANEYIYEASKVEVDRQKALEEIQELNKKIDDEERGIIEIDKRIATTKREIKEKSVDITIKRLEQSKIRSKQVKRARGVILEEIKLLKRLLDDEFPDPFMPGKKVRGQIGVMARQVEHTLINQLREDFKKAEAELDKAIDAERERRKKEKRRRLISGTCRFFGAVVGSIYGGPAGAALGAEIGGFIAEAATGIMENKPPEQILTGLIDNGFAIAQAAGYDLEKELNTLGAKTADQAGQFFNQLEAGLQPLLDSMPNIFDEQLVSDAIKILDLGEIQGLETLLKSSYADLKKDVNSLGTLGTALKNAVVPQAGTEFIKIDDPKQLLSRLSDTLFQQTKTDLTQLKALAKSVGEKVENLDNLSDEQKEALAKLAADKLSKLVVSQVGQESINYRRDVITKWINSKRVPKKFWNDPTVQQEAKALVAELFQDSKAREAALENIQGALLDPKAEQGRMRAQIQEVLSPWQAELDVYLAKVTAVDKGAQPPSNAKQAAQANVDYLRNSIKQFDEELLPFLKGDKGTKRNELILKLDEQVRAAANKTDDLEFQTIETDISKLTIEQAEDQLKQVRERLGQIEIEGKIADIRVSQASIEIKAVQLAKLRETNLQEAQKNTLEAAKARREASKARVKAAKAGLESKQALVEGASKRGAEASRIRVLLSQPPLRLFDKSQVLALETANARRKHAEALTRALRAYREQLRYFLAFQGTEPKLNLNLRTWSNILNDWLNDKVSTFSTATVPSSFSTLIWQLTPEQIASLFTSSGFRVVVGPQVPRSESFPIFSVSETWTDLLTKDQMVIPENSPWRSEFQRHGIVLADNAETKEETTDEKWKIVNYRQSPVSVVAYPEDASKRFTWEIPVETEPTVEYSVKKENGQLTVARRQGPPSEGRSPYNNYFFDFIPAVQASKARVIGVVLNGKIGSSGQPLQTNDYTVEIEHLGDTYTSNKTVALHRAKKLSTNRFRWLDDSSMTASEAIKQIQELSAIDGDDDDPFRITGTPLSGTTVIRLIPSGQSKFFNLEIQIVWKFYT